MERCCLKVFPGDHPCIICMYEYFIKITQYLRVYWIYRIRILSWHLFIFFHFTIVIRLYTIQIITDVLDHVIVLYVNTSRTWLAYEYWIFEMENPVFYLPPIVTSMIWPLHNMRILYLYSILLQKKKNTREL